MELLEPLNMPYPFRQATISDIPLIVRHRELMFREMGIPTEFDDMSGRDGALAPPCDSFEGVPGLDRGFESGEVAGGSGLIVIPWPPGPMTMDPRCGFVFNVYTAARTASRGSPVE